MQSSPLQRVLPWVHLQGAVLDRHSACCTSGVVDACGECHGPAKAVDVQNACCTSGVLDGDGYCCASGLLDECGVCDGQSRACALRAVVDVQVSTAALMHGISAHCLSCASHCSSSSLGLLLCPLVPIIAHQKRLSQRCRRLLSGDHTVLAFFAIG